MKIIPRVKDRLARPCHAGRIDVACTFFEGPAEWVAPRLLGKILAHRTAAGVLAGRIVEVEAYLGPSPQNTGSGGPLVSRPYAAKPHSVRPTRIRLRLRDLRALLLHECDLRSSMGKAGCMLLRALEPMTNLVFPDGGQSRHSSPASPSRRTHFRPQPPLPGAGSYACLRTMALTWWIAKSPLQLRDDGFPDG